MSKEICYYIKDSTIKNEPEAFNINHISDETREKYGVPFKDIYYELKEDLLHC